MTSTTREQVGDQRNRIIQWSEGREQLVKHIINGAARGLYSQQVANMAIKYLEPVGEIELDNLIDLVSE